MSKDFLQIKQAVTILFSQMTNMLQQLSDAEYSTANCTLSNASIGQHVRHVIELFAELDKGYETGIVNYERRKRDHRIETNRHVAASLIDVIENTIYKDDKALILETNFTESEETPVSLSTNYYRELAYNIEHTIHHMALMKIGLNELSTIKVDENFGIAAATIKYRKACVQ